MEGQMATNYRRTARTIETLGAELDELREAQRKLRRPLVHPFAPYRAVTFGVGCLALGLVGAGLAADLIVHFPAVRLGVVALCVIVALFGILIMVLSAWRDVRP